MRKGVKVYEKMTLLQIVFIQNEYYSQKKIHKSGIEPEAIDWKSIMLPLHHSCRNRTVGIEPTTEWFLRSKKEHSHLLSQLS